MSSKPLWNGIDLLYCLSMDYPIKFSDSVDVSIVSVIVIFYLFGSIKVHIRHTPYGEETMKRIDNLSSL